VTEPRQRVRPGNEIVGPLRILSTQRDKAKGKNKPTWRRYPVEPAYTREKPLTGRIIGISARPLQALTGTERKSFRGARERGLNGVYRGGDEA